MSITNFNIADVARLHGIQTIRETSSEIFAVCPFCGNKKGKFSYIVKKGDKENIYHCYDCGAGGKALNLHMSLSNKDEYSGLDGYKVAIRDILSAINHDTSFEDTHVDMKNYHAAVVAEKASAEHCSKVYYALLKELRLKDCHKQDLLRRGLTEDQIRRFKYRSTPDYKSTWAICRALIRKGYSLEGVPGFYRGKKGDWTMHIAGYGYFCPAYNGNLISGFQIRVDNPQNGCKYIWFSSGGKNTGVSSGAPISYLPGKRKDIILLTEGILKSEVVFSMLNDEITVVGVPGINTLSSLKLLLDQLDKPVFLFEAFDMDKVLEKSDIPTFLKAKELVQENGTDLDTLFAGKNYPAEFKEVRRKYGIAKAAKTLLQTISEYQIQTHPLRWDLDGDYWKGQYKGLDDFLLDYEPKDGFVSYLTTKADKVLQMQKYFQECKIS